MTLEDTIRTLAKRWLWVLLPALLLTGLGAAYGKSQPATYEATSQVLFTVDAGNSATDLNQASNYLERQMTSYAGVATTPLVLEPVVEELGLDETPQDLAEDVSSSFETGSALMSFTVIRGDAAEAAKIANAVAKNMVERTDELSPAPAKLPRTVKASQLTQAIAPTTPGGLPWLATAFAGGFIGLLCGLGLAFVVDALDRRLRSTTDVRQATGIPLAGRLRNSSPTPAGLPMPPGLRDDFRGLRAATESLFPSNGSNRPLLVTALHDRGGATTVALGLARSHADAGRRVLLVDRDVREAGLTQLLEATSSASPTAGDPQVRPLGPGLDLLPAQAAEDTVDRLDSALGAVADGYDVVIVDSAGLLDHPDAQLVAQTCSAALVVVRAGRDTSTDLAKGGDLLAGPLKERIGVVLNRSRG